MYILHIVNIFPTYAIDNLNALLQKLRAIRVAKVPIAMTNVTVKLWTSHVRMMTSNFA